MARRRVGGTIQLYINGQVHLAKGEFSWGYGVPQRTAVVGEDGIHGYTEEQQVAFIEGMITDTKDIVITDLVTAEELSCQLDTANGKTLLLPDAWYAADATGTSKEGEITFRVESTARLQEVLPSV